MFIDGIILTIIIFCHTEIDNRFDKKYCVDYMRKCVIDERYPLDKCAEYYNTQDTHWFIGE